MSGFSPAKTDDLQLTHFVEHPQRGSHDIGTVVGTLRLADRRPRAAGFFDLAVLDGRNRAARDFDVVLAAALYRVANCAARLLDGVVATRRTNGVLGAAALFDPVARAAVLAGQRVVRQGAERDKDRSGQNDSVHGGDLQGSCHCISNAPAPPADEATIRRVMLLILITNGP